MTLPSGYTLPVADATIVQQHIGTLYHLALGTKSDPALANPDRVVGYVLAPRDLMRREQLGGGSAFEETTDLHAKDQLTQYSSPLITDRDLTNTPRQSQIDFSGGGLSTVYTDVAKTRYFDSDLDTRVPGYVTLRASANDLVAIPGPGRPATGRLFQQVVAFANDFYFSASMPAGTVNLWNTHTSFTVAQVSPQMLATDGTYVYLADGTSCYPMTAGGTVNGAVFTSTVGAVVFDRMWVINQGSAGHFVYYCNGDINLYKVDLSQYNPGVPIPSANHALVPLGGSAIRVMDMVKWKVGIAIITNDENATGFDVWYYDGLNTTPVVRVDGYKAVGACTGLGDVFVSAQPISGFSSPALFRVTDGVFQQVATPGSPLNTSVAQTALQPKSSGRYVYWPLIGASITQATAGNSQFVVTYDILTGAVAHHPFYGQGPVYGLQIPEPDFSSLNRIAILGDTVGFPYTIKVGSNAILDFISQRSNQYTPGGVAWQTSGRMVTARYDQNTPAIGKLFRRGVAKHQPLRAGESIRIDAYLDQDPLSAVLTPGAGLSVTNSTLGSSKTILHFPDGTIGRSVFYVVTLNGPGTSTPVWYDIATEINVPWAFLFTVDCVAKVANLQQFEDQQGYSGRDKYFFLHQLQEQPQPIYLFHPNGITYPVVLESIKFFNDNPHFPETDGPADLEWIATVQLRYEP